jgi:nicotinamide-nucleotide amidase
MRAVVIAVGDELVSGRTVDTNSAHVAAALAEAGVQPHRQITVGDAEDDIAEAVSEAAAAAEVVVVTGGLGPTADDLTRQGLAKALGAELALDEASLSEIEAFFRLRGRRMRGANRVQAMVPAGAEALPNPLGTAPGIAARLGRARVFALPGVPHEMERMFAEQVAPRLPAGRGATFTRLVHAFGAGESDIAAEIADLMDRGAAPTVGITACSGLISIRVVARAAGAEAARRQAEGCVREVRRRLGQLVVGEDGDTLAAAVGRALRERRQTLATAESCTGGLLGALLTDVAGSSDYYLGGVVAYADDLKRDALGVPEAMLAEHGAVSEPVAAAMASGCRERFASHWAVGVTGIAGPAGGSEDKPVGLAYVALAAPDGTNVERHVFPGDRATIRGRAAMAAMNALRLALTGDA